MGASLQGGGETMSESSAPTTSNHRLVTTSTSTTKRTIPTEAAMVSSTTVGRMPLLFALLTALALGNFNRVSVSAQSAVGDAVCAEGIAMDFFCIAMGFLFDNPSIATLEGPTEHSVHCLIEVTECISTPYEILLPPPSDGSTSGLYTRGYRLDDTAKADVMALAKRVGSCGSCDGTGTIQRGLTVVVQGQVVQEAFSDVPPTISGTVALSDPGAPVCAVQQGATPSATPGTAPPTSAAPVADTMTPSGPSASVSPSFRPTAARALPSMIPSAATTPVPITVTPVPSSALPAPPATPASPGVTAPSGSPVQGGDTSSNGPTSAATWTSPDCVSLWIAPIVMAWIVFKPIKQ
jgi:hypothetical protein